jgi:hypothetical protein
VTDRAVANSYRLLAAFLLVACLVTTSCRDNSPGTSGPTVQQPTGPADQTEDRAAEADTASDDAGMIGVADPQVRPDVEDEPIALPNGIPAMNLDTPVAEKKRLIHFQPVGFSHPSAAGLVSPAVCTPERGWQAHVDHTLRPLVRRLGPGTFDWWGHRIGGVWADRMPYNEKTSAQTFFEQLDSARQRFPKMVDFAPLVQFASANDMDLYAYVGFPRCDQLEIVTYDVVPEHCDPDSMDRWYGELVEFGFKGVGHDWSQELPATSGAMRVNFPYLTEHGMEVFIEAMPRRRDRHFLGYSVVTSETRFQTTQSRPEEFFTADEIRAAGGRVVIIMAHPRPDFSGDRFKWRFDRAVARLTEGETVAINLLSCVKAGLPVENLVELASRDVPRN